MEGSNTATTRPNNFNQETNKIQGHNEEADLRAKAELIQIIDHLFDPANLVKNAYLLNRCNGNDDFEIQPRWIYAERSISAVTTDKPLINAALDGSKNVILNKTGDFVNSVRPRTTQLKRKVAVEYPKEKQDVLRSFIFSLEEDVKSKIPINYYNTKLGSLILVCRDDATATYVFEKLSNSELEGEKLKCSQINETVYQAGQEYLSRKAKEYNNQQQSAPPMYNQNLYNPYPMQGYYGNFVPYQQYYMPMPGYSQSYYPDMQYMYQNVPTPMYTQVPYNNQTPYNKKPYNPNYRNDKKPYVKKPRQPRDNDNQYGNKLSTKSSSIEVNDSEFPALN